MSIPKHKYLLTYRYAEIIHDLTVAFCQKYIDYKSRTKDQTCPHCYAKRCRRVEQAARSGKQNIVEGVSAGQTSKKGEIKLLGVAKSSFEELLADYEDFLRQRAFETYPKSHPKVSLYRQTAYRLSNLSNLSDLGNLIERPKLPGDPAGDANFLLTLCHQATYLLNKQIISLEDIFVNQGGYTENLFQRRLDSKINQNIS